MTHPLSHLPGWVRSASGDTAEGIPRIEQGKTRDLRATGAVLGLPHNLTLKAEALRAWS
jgi:hypothetical protein